MRIHHIGYLVKNIEKAAVRFACLGYVKKGQSVFDGDRLVDICFMVNGEYCVELVAPRSKESPVYGLLSRYRNSPYHICYECRHLEETVSKLAENGFVMMQEPAPAVALEGRRVAFMMGADMGIAEFLETDD